MLWNSNYLVVRPVSENQITLVYTAQKLKDARYWLQYMAEIGDAILITPLNDHYKGDGEPAYMCHLANIGKMEYNENHWKNSYNIFEKPAFEETKIVEVNQDFQKLMQTNNGQLSVILSEPSKWLNNESTLTLKSGEVYLVSVNPDSEWPLTVTLKPFNNKEKNTKMEFMVRPRCS